MFVSNTSYANQQGVRGAFLHFVNDPFFVAESDSYRFIEDGLMVIDDGKVKELDQYDKVVGKYPGLHIDSYSNSVIVPGFVDTHIHYAQTEMIASYGEQLLEWLNKYTFPAERKFEDEKYASETADFFLRQLLANGTTTALIFGTVHPQSIDALFEKASKLNMRLIAGKVMMDRKDFAPDYLRDTADSSYEQSKALIQKWHGKGRLLYAITPRFAITSTDEQLARAGQLKREFPDVYLQTHISENLEEIKTVASLFPSSRGYLDVYDHYGLLGSKSIFAHGVHLTDSEFQRLSVTQSSIAFCPTSNLFLGSGLFKIKTAKSSENPVRVGMGTDIGAGTSFSMLQTMNEAYKVAAIQGQKLSIFRSLYLATLGGATALSLDDKIGNFLPGKEADFTILDFNATELESFRMSHISGKSHAEILQEKLFVLATLGDDREVLATYIMGQRAYLKK
jgi:guanine deaminase